MVPVAPTVQWQAGDDSRRFHPRESLDARDQRLTEGWSVIKRWRSISRSISIRSSWTSRNTASRSSARRAGVSRKKLVVASITAMRSMAASKVSNRSESVRDAIRSSDCGTFEVTFERSPTGISSPLHWIEGCGPHRVDHSFLANQPPMVPITAPADGISVPLGAPVFFSGWAEDPEEGGLPGSSLVWESSLDGLLGIGDSIERDDLSAGIHTVTLTATDSEGMGASDSIQVLVPAALLPDVMIDFETLPDGTFPCPGGARRCALRNQFLGLGVVFSAEVEAPCEESYGWGLQSTAAYDPSGAPPTVKPQEEPRRGDCSRSVESRRNPPPPPPAEIEKGPHRDFRWGRMEAAGVEQAANVRPSISVTVYNIDG
jgi:hypothetical protein